MNEFTFFVNSFIEAGICYDMIKTTIKAELKWGTYFLRVPKYHIFQSLLFGKFLEVGSLIVASSISSFHYC